MATKVTTPITKRSREQHLADLHTSLYELESSRDNLFNCGLEPGQVGFICGPGGQGKSFLTAQLAMSLALGLPLLGRALAPTRPARAVYVALEEAQEEIARREAAIRDVYQALGVNLDLSQLAQRFDVATISDNADTVGLFDISGNINQLMISTLEALVMESDEHEAARLLILDPLNWLVGLDESRNDVASRFMPLIISLAKRWHCAILVIGHITKSSSRDAKNGNGDAPVAEDLRGAGAFSTGARWVANLVPVCPPRKTQRKKDDDESDNDAENRHKNCTKAIEAWTAVRVNRIELLKSCGRADLVDFDLLCRPAPFKATDDHALLSNRLQLVGTKRNSGGPALAPQMFTRVQAGVLVPDDWKRFTNPNILDDFHRAPGPDVPTMYLPPFYPEGEEVK